MPAPMRLENADAELALLAASALEEEPAPAPAPAPVLRDVLLLLLPPLPPGAASNRWRR